ncbi:hypothetical protein HN801_01470 [Candidatus Peregrinibacteria bacterium]|mgnify:CR=1 FL=1|jgi:hypothetical protein|nr:hypothetical protein [Candidatus Peregrinibacteria bacterium]
MKVGDLVKCKDDEGGIFGLGLVIEEETTRDLMVRVLWLSGSARENTVFDGKDDWNWKSNLELVKAI